jgi:hypothetical protein
MHPLPPCMSSSSYNSSGYLASALPESRPIQMNTTAANPARVVGLESGSSGRAGPPGEARGRISSCFDRTYEIAGEGKFSLLNASLIYLSPAGNSQPFIPAFARSAPTLLSLARTSHARRPRAPGSPYGAPFSSSLLCTILVRC